MTLRDASDEIDEVAGQLDALVDLLAESTELQIKETPVISELNRAIRALNTAVYKIRVFVASNKPA